jgi:hypothetical protein
LESFDADNDDLSTHTPLPRTKEEFDERSEEFRKHPVWDLLSPTEYYDVTEHWDWTPELGYTPTTKMWANEWDKPANVEEEPETTFGYINREIRRKQAESFPKVQPKSGKIPENYVDLTACITRRHYFSMKMRHETVNSIQYR